MGELLRRPVDLMATYGTPPTEAAKVATTTSPIVMAASAIRCAPAWVARLAPRSQRQAAAAPARGDPHGSAHRLSRQFGQCRHPRRARGAEAREHVEGAGIVRIGEIGDARYRGD